MLRWGILLLGVGLAGCATAPAPACETAFPQAWISPRPLASATAAARLAPARFEIAQPVALRLHPDPEVAYVTLPQGEGEETSFGGLATFTVERAGLYSVGMGASPWVDVSRDGQPTPTVAFGRAPECSAARKFVSFELAPGDYVLEISGNESAELVLVVVAGR